MRNNKQYNGNMPKFGISYNNKDYIVKYSMSDDLSVVSEYVASVFVKCLGGNVYEVQLAQYRGSLVDLISDFTSGTDNVLHSFKSIRQSFEDVDIGESEYTYKDVLYLINNHLKMSDSMKLQAKKQFWDMFIYDAILGNRDRHWGNWGYLTSRGSYFPAPIYDNGACLFPNVNRVYREYLDRTTRYKFLYDRVFVFPASLFKIQGKDRYYRSNYAEMFSDLRINKLFAERVKLIKGSFTVASVRNIISQIVTPLNIPIWLKQFYIGIVTLRYACIVCRHDFDKEVVKWQILK